MENKTKFITLRITPTLHKLVKESANKELRTLSDQINYILIKELGKTPRK